MGPWTGEAEFQEIVRAVESRNGRRPLIEEDAPSISSEATISSAETLQSPSTQEQDAFKTPVHNLSPDPSLLCAPLLPPNDARVHIPALVSGHDEPTPTPTPIGVLSPASTTSV